MNTYKYTKDGLVKDIINFKLKHGRLPLTSELRSSNNLATYPTYSSRFDGGYDEAKNLALRRL